MRRAGLHDLPYTSPIPPLYLPYISAISPLHLGLHDRVLAEERGVQRRRVGLEAGVGHLLDRLADGEDERRVDEGDDDVRVVLVVAPG